MMLHGEYKAPGEKLVVVDFSVEQEKLRNFNLSGDFFLEPDETLFTINRAIEGQATAQSAEFYSDLIKAALPADAALIGITPDSVGIAIRRALTDAARWRNLKWEVIVGDAFSPVMNVALDEVLVQQVGAGKRPPTMRIWDWHGDAVVIGSFQSVKNEVDYEAATAFDTTVIRRISGGGAMYMQPQASITYSIYVPTSFVADLSFEESYQFLDEWVIEALHTLGISAEYKPLNDIASSLGKIGGAAQKRLASGALLHHVTMAYDIDAERMTSILRIGREKLSDKGTKSANKRVDPLRSQTGLSRDEIVARLVEVFTARHSATTGYITNEELKLAETLVEEKFLTEEWLHRVP